MAVDVIPETIPVSSALSAIPMVDAYRSMAANPIAIRTAIARETRSVLSMESANSRAEHQKIIRVEVGPLRVVPEAVDREEVDPGDLAPEEAVDPEEGPVRTLIPVPVRILDRRPLNWKLIFSALRALNHNLSLDLHRVNTPSKRTVLRIKRPDRHRVSTL